MAEELIGEGVAFDRYGRITGYVSKLNKFNDAKQEEFNERVKHDTSEFTEPSCPCSRDENDE